MLRRILDNSDNYIENEEIVRFGFERIKVAIIVSLLIIVTGGILHEIVRSILLLIFLLPLRQNAGGYHMRSSRNCAIFSYFVFLILIMILKYVELGLWICILIWGICFTTILILSPVGNENHPLDTMEKKVYGRRARIICCIESGLFFALVYFDISYIYRIIIISEIVTAILLVIGIVQEKIGNRK